MSASFPAFRFLGEKDIAVTHIKRGMLELFRTQEVQRRMGVPVFQRTVNVDDYTSIRVSINKKQTFIYIESTRPPEDAEKPEPPEELEPDRELCPASFLIRKFDSSLKDSGQGDSDGYLIAYNQKQRRWQIASFLTADGETVPYAANLAWWHNKGSLDGTVKHSPCDLVSWHGLSSPDFSAPFLPSVQQFGETHPLQKTFLRKVFYFQGIKYNSPNQDYVLGACILVDRNENNEDIEYMYAHTCTLSTITTGSNVRTYRMGFDRSSKISLASLLSGGTTWTTVGTRNLTDLGFQTNNSVSTPGMGHPRSAAYIDKDGYSYVIRECSDIMVIDYKDLEQPDINDEYNSKTAFIRYNLRNMQAEIISSSDTSAPQLDAVITATQSPYSPGSGVNIQNPGQGMSITYSYSNVSRPWIFYVMPGTEDLYTYGLEFQYAAYGSRTVTKSVPDDEAGGVPGFYETVIKGHTDLIVYKNQTEIDRVRIFSINNHQSMTEPPVINSQWEYVANEVDIRCLQIYEHHPDIRNSWRYSETALTQTSCSISYTEDGETSPEYFAAVPEFGPLTAGGNPTCYMLAAIKTHKNLAADEEVYNFKYPVVLSQAVPAGASFGGAGSVPPSGIWSHRPSMIVSHMFGNTLSCALREPFCYPYFEFGSAQTSLIPYSGITARYMGSIIGAGRQYISRDVHKYGSQTGFIFAKSTAGVGLWDADAFAVHRHVRGMDQKPFLQLRRPIYNTTHQTLVDGKSPATFANQSEHQFTIYLADSLPSADPDVDPYNQGDGGGGTTNSRFLWNWWTGPLGNVQDPDPPYDAAFKESNWTLVSNFTTASRLNSLTDEADNIFFDIGVL